MLGHVLGYNMAWCYQIANNYGIAMIIFTFIMKIILLPISILIHMNSIKMVKMQPGLNFLKADYFGDPDKINEEQLNLYKKYNYRPMLGLVPLFIQIILLMGVKVAAAALRYSVLSLPLSAWIIMCNMMLQSIGKGLKASIVASARQGIFFLPLIMILPRFFGLAGVEACQAVSDFFALTVSIPLGVSVIREMQREEKEANFRSL